jgi:hypothetical protein
VKEKEVEVGKYGVATEREKNQRGLGLDGELEGEELAPGGR